MKDSLLFDVYDVEVKAIPINQIEEVMSEKKSAPIVKNQKAPKPPKKEVVQFKNEIVNGVIMNQVESSNISHVGYVHSENTLYIKFTGKDDIYIYKDVPNNVFKSMMSSDSVGRFISRNVKNVYKFEQYKPKTEEHGNNNETKKQEKESQDKGGKKSTSPYD